MGAQRNRCPAPAGKRAQKGGTPCRRLFALIAKGAKAGFGIACSDRGCRPIERACDFCGGEGRVSPEANERWQKGRAARDGREKQRLSLGEKATVLGIAP